MFLDRAISFFTSLRLTVFCLGCALVLVFAGTLAQVNLGLYVTQARYFHSLFVYWTPPGTHLNIPVWPGGYLLGGLLLVNLIAAHIKRFSLTWKKSGLFLIHAGLILLFLGQFFTELFQVETFMRIEEGQTKNYSESARHNELAIVDVTDTNRDQVTVIPESWIMKPGEVHQPGLPFTLKVKEYHANSYPAPMMASVAGGIHRIQATQGIGARLAFQPRPVTTASDDENVPIALIEIATPTGSLGSWTVANWFTRDLGYLHQAIGDDFASLAHAPQEFTVGNKKYQIALRPVRHYKPFSITLLDFDHKVYKGTDIPKDFASRIRLDNPATGEQREVRIYMNNPLRYAGETFYQGGFERGDRVSILQVVRNPAWLTPYVSCTLVGAGLLVHFLMHLIKFAKRTAQKTPAQAQESTRKPKASAGSKATAGALSVSSSMRSSFEPAKRRNV